MIVRKFGGTSMGSAESIRQVADIVDTGVVVVSAVGGVTDSLIELGELAVGGGGDWGAKLEELKAKHAAITKGLEIEVDLGPMWASLEKLIQGVELTQELSGSIADKIVTFGERMSSEILATLLRVRGREAEAVNAFECVFANDFKVDFDKTNKAIVEHIGGLLKKGITPVVTGFVAQSPSGSYTTLGRGGSDYTAAIVAAALGAEELQIWTDVDGILNTDPRIVEAASVLEQVSFLEASELAYFGAKVLHPKTIRPAIKKEIPVRILNTFNPEAAGTLIDNREDATIKSVTHKKGITVVNVCSAGMLEAHGFLARIFEVFARHNVVVDVVSTSEVSVSMTVEGKVPEKVLDELSEFSTVEVDEGMAIICLVGCGIKGRAGVIGKLFTAVDEHNVRMVSVGASRRNITFLVKEGEAVDVVQKVFNQFFS